MAGAMKRFSTETISVSFFVCVFKHNSTEWWLVNVLSLYYSDSLIILSVYTLRKFYKTLSVGT